MNSRAAMREAHRIASDLINQARSTAADGWSDDADDHEHIDSALGILAQRHDHAAGVAVAHSSTSACAEGDSADGGGRALRLLPPADRFQVRPPAEAQDSIRSALLGLQEQHGLTDAEMAGSHPSGGDAS